MPSPLGHALAGAAAGWLVAGAPGITGRRERARALTEAALFGALAMLPDVDLLFGSHRGPTHSIGAAVVVGAIAGIVVSAYSSARTWWSRSRLPFALACAAAYGSHIPLDWLSHDNTPPIGIMALWPVSHDYFASHVQVFLAISRRYYHGWRFLIQNGIAVAREIAILGPIAALVIVARRRRQSNLRS